MLFDQPEHPYSVGLMNAIPRPDLPDVAPKPIDGAPPDMLHPPSGCPFHPRCSYSELICVNQIPPCGHWPVGMTLPATLLA